MINRFIAKVSKLTTDYINITVSEPYETIKTNYKSNKFVKTNKFSFSEYIKKQKQMTSPELRNTIYVNNSELRKTYIRDFKSNKSIH